MATLAGCSVPTNESASITRAPDIASAPINRETAFDGVATEQTPVYWVGTGDQSGYLFREFRTPERPESSDPVAEAVQLMTSAKPLDPDYRTLWTPVDTVGTSVSPDGTITVDLPAEALSTHLSSADAQLALQQLVYTVSAAAVTAGILDSASDKRVRVLVDGQSGHRAFGAVDLGEPVSRDASLAAPVWLIDPQTDSQLGSPVTLFGRVLPSVRHARWEVLDGDRSVRSGQLPSTSSSSSGPSGSGGEFRVPVELTPGTYIVRVTATNRDGEQLRDDHEVRVVER